MTSLGRGGNFGGGRRVIKHYLLMMESQVSHDRLVIQGSEGSWSWSSRSAVHVCPQCNLDLHLLNLTWSV